MPSTNACPNGAAHTSPGQRPGNQSTHISGLQRNAADGRITYPNPNGYPHANDAAPERCGAPSERILNHHPCPDAYPPSVSRMHIHHPTPRVAPWAGMRCPFGANGMLRSFRAHPYPPSVSRMHAHRPIPRVAPWAGMRCPFGANGTRQVANHPPAGRDHRGASKAARLRRNGLGAGRGGAVGWNVEERRRAASEYTRQELNLRPTDSKSGALSN